MMIRPAHATALCAVTALILLHGCGSGSEDPSPSPLDPRIPEDGNYYLGATITLLEANLDPQDVTVLPVDCDGISYPPGTVFTMSADEAGGGLVFGAPRNEDDEPWGNPTFVDPIVAGTDRVQNLAVILTMPNIFDVSIIQSGPPYTWPKIDPAVVGMPQGAAQVSLDAFCSIEERVSYVTLPRNTDCQCLDPDARPPDTLYCDYGCDDCIILTDYTLMTEDDGDVVFEPSSPVEGTASFEAQARFLSGGQLWRARIQVDMCFRFPAIAPEVPWYAVPAPSCPHSDCP